MPGGDGTGPAGRGGGFFRRGFGRRVSRAGPDGECVCPACGKRIAHTTAQPCNQVTCPQCGAKMTRA